MKNNLSVALLKAGKPQEAYDAVLGTDEIFAREEDVLRQAIALGNLAAALEALGKRELAIEKYEQSADLFSKVGDGEKRSLVLKSAAALKIRQGKVIDSALSMIGSVESSPKPNLIQRILKFFLRIKP